MVELAIESPVMAKDLYGHIQDFIVLGTQCRNHAMRGKESSHKALSLREAGQVVMKSYIQREEELAIFEKSLKTFMKILLH